MKKILSTLLLSILLVTMLAGCGGAAESQDSLKSVADQIITGHIEAAKADDFESFAAYFDESVPQEELQSQFEACQNYEMKENRDIEIFYSNDTSFGASVFDYTNLIADDKTRTISDSLRFVFEKTDGKWLLVGNDSYSSYWQDYVMPEFVAFYGDVANTGYINPNHQIFFNKVLGTNFDTACKTAEFDENGDLKLTFSLINGLDNDIFDVVYSKLILRDADDNVIADLSGLSVPFGDALKSKTIADYTVTVPASEVVSNPGNDVLKYYISIETSNTYQDRIK